MKRVILVALCGVMAAGVVLAEKPGMHAGGKRGEGRFGKHGRGHGPEVGVVLLLTDSTIVEQAGVTEQEVVAIRESSYEHRMAMIDLEAQIEKARLNVRRLQSEAGTDPAVVEAAMDEVGRLETEAEKARYRHREQMTSILGDERMEVIIDLGRELREDRFMKQKERRGRKDEPSRKGQGKQRRMKPGATPAGE